MPLGPSGEYVPLTASQKREYIDHAANLIRQNPGISQKELADRASAAIGLPHETSLPLYSLNRQAKKEVAAGEAAERSPGQAPAESTLPKVPGDPTTIGRIVTDIVVEITDPRTGEKSTRRGEIDSPAPISKDQAQQYIEGNLTAWLAKLGYLAPAGIPVEDLQIDVIILGVFISA